MPPSRRGRHVTITGVFRPASAASGSGEVIDPTGEMKSAVSSVETDMKEVKSATQISPVGPIAPPAVIPAATPAIAAPDFAKDNEAPADAAAAKVEAEAKV